MFDNALRNLLLSLSNNKNFEKFLVNSKITKKFVNRFVAGYDLTSALEILNKLNSLNTVSYTHLTLPTNREV